MPWTTIRSSLDVECENLSNQIQEAIHPNPSWWGLFQLLFCSYFIRWPRTGKKKSSGCPNKYSNCWFFVRDIYFIYICMCVCLSKFEHPCPNFKQSRWHKLHCCCLKIENSEKKCESFSLIYFYIYLFNSIIIEFCLCPNSNLCPRNGGSIWAAKSN